MKDFIKKYKGEFITFFINIFILLVIFKLVGITDNSIIKSDMHTQMLPLFNHLKLFLSGEVGLFNFNFGLGDDFLGIIYYYLMSPFNILVLFIKNYNVLFSLIIILKSAFASVFCFKYLKYQEKKSKTIYLIIFSLLYGLSSYFLSYNFLIQFLDVYMIFPLLLLGIDKMVKEKKYILYVVSLMLVILFNYYFAYMVCIFLFLYYNYRVLLNKMGIKEYLKKNGYFILISFFTCLSMSFILLPIAKELGTYSRDNSLFLGGESFTFLFNFKEFIYHYIIGDFNNIDILNIDSFYIYSSIICIPLIYFYFRNKKFSMKEKILSGIMFLILLLSIGFNYFNYIWHGFVLPCCFNGRYTFMFILFIIMISYKSISNIKNIKIKDYFIIFIIIYFIIFFYLFINFPRLIDINILLSFFIIYILVIGISIYIKNKDNRMKYYIYLYGFIISISFLLILFKLIDLSYFYRLLLIPVCVYLFNIIFKEKNIKFKYFIWFFLIILICFSLYLFYSNRLIFGYSNLFKIVLLLFYLIIIRLSIKNKCFDYILCLLIIIELICNGYGYLNRFNYRKYSEDTYNKVIGYIKEYDNSKFYRIEDNYSENVINYSFMYDYNGIDYFMSTIKKDFVNFFKELDVWILEDSGNSVFYDASYELLSSLLNIKYYVEFDDYTYDYYEKIKSIGNYTVYENKNSLNYGYMVNSNIKELNVSNNGLLYINDIYKMMSNNDKDILTKVNLYKKDDLNYTFINSSNKDLFMIIKIDKEKCRNSDILSDIVYFNGEDLNNSKIDSIFKINNKYGINEEIEIKLPSDFREYILDVYLYYYDRDIYLEDIDILKKNSFEVTDVFKNGLIGNIDTDIDGVLFLSCLYNDDLNVYVDGEKQDKVKLLNTFMGVELSKGKHEIRIIYKSKIIYISFIPSLFGIIFLLIIYYKSNKLKK